MRGSSQVPRDASSRALARELVSFSSFGSGIVLLGLEHGGSISGLTRANIGEWVMTTCRDQAPRGGARRGLCEGRRRGRIGRRNGGFVNLPDAGRVAGQDPNLGGCSRSTRHHVPFGERSGAERAVMSGP